MIIRITATHPLKRVITVTHKCHAFTFVTSILDTGAGRRNPAGGTTCRTWGIRFVATHGVLQRRYRPCLSRGNRGRRSGRSIPSPDSLGVRSHHRARHVAIGAHDALTIRHGRGNILHGEHGTGRNVDELHSRLPARVGQLFVREHPLGVALRSYVDRWCVRRDFVLAFAFRSLAHTPFPGRRNGDRFGGQRKRPHGSAVRRLGRINCFGSEDVGYRASVGLVGPTTCFRTHGRDVVQRVLVGIDRLWRTHDGRWADTFLHSRSAIGSYGHLGRDSALHRIRIIQTWYSFRMMIVKAGGGKAPFDIGKIGDTLRRIGATEELVKQVTQKVTEQVKNNMSTREVYRIVRSELKKESRSFSNRFNLRNGLLKLGPAGFKFEKYVAAILEAYQYVATVPEDEIRGKCVLHEVDVVAAKDGKQMMIEAKFRNKFNDPVTLKDAMSTWARWMDLNDGAKAAGTPKYDEVWIVTNGRFSDRAEAFGKCRGIKMIDWNSKEHSLARMVDHNILYPVTVIDGLKQWELEQFSKKGLMLCRQVSKKLPKQLSVSTGISVERTQSIIDRCREVVTG